LSVADDLTFEPARPQDVDAYIAMARAAQALIDARGLTQYVPAAHPGYEAAMRARALDGSLRAVWQGDRPVAFFSIERTPSQWWPPDDAHALYLSGMVIDASMHGRQLGSRIIEWCVAEAARLQVSALRLDCHAGNAWLRSYYEARGFTLKAELEQHPGYFGCIYERQIPRNE
jgi:GNAT superfamily N-acetyltransferase